jgi:hypothetical protein
MTQIALKWADRSAVVSVVAFRANYYAFVTITANASYCSIAGYTYYFA